MAAKQSGMVIIGGGIMGGDIATIFAAGNWAVHVMSPSQKTRDALPGRMTAGLEKLGADNGADVEFNEVLAIGEGASTTFGSPLSSASFSAQVRFVRTPQHSPLPCPIAKPQPHECIRLQCGNADLPAPRPPRAASTAAINHGVSPRRRNFEF